MIFKSLKVPEKVDKEEVTKTYGKFVLVRWKRVTV